MAKQQELEPEHRIQKWAPYVVGAVLVAAIGFYFWHFPSGFSNKHSVWGQFGDFIGGLVNPIIGFFTIWLLAVSLRQNHRALHQSNQALNQANTALGQAKAELELTRTAIEQAAHIQAATENALTKQIEIAEHARDMNNAVSIHEHLSKVSEDLKNMRGTPIIKSDELTAKMKINKHQLEQLGKVLDDERLRLVGIYGDKSA